MKISAGILAFRFSPHLEVFLVHPGGPFYKNKNEGFWTIPKGEIDPQEQPLEAAKREFFEETGEIVEGNFIALEPITQKAGKKVFCWAVEKDFDAELISSNHFEMEWPPKSKKLQSFPEVDRGEWFTIEAGKKMILESQIQLLEQIQLLV